MLFRKNTVNLESGEKVQEIRVLPELEEERRHWDSVFTWGGNVSL